MLPIMTWKEYEPQFKDMALNAGMRKVDIDAWLVYSKKLFIGKVPIIYDMSHLSKLVGYSTNYLLSVCNNTAASYKIYNIKKKSGGNRIIAEPLTSLKEIQRWVLVNILEKQRVSKYAKAYVKGRSIKENARFHKNQDQVLTVDLKDFFGSIKPKTIYSVFRVIGYSRQVSAFLCNLCCLNGSLPQGAPTSAALSNLVFKNNDSRLSNFCNKLGIRYTRYADDLTFSFNNDVAAGMVIKFVKKILSESDFELNDNKTRLMHRHQRQEVTGIVVNEKLQCNSVVRRQIRQEFFYIKRYGLSGHMSRKNVINEEKYLRHLIGVCDFIIHINPNDEEVIEYRRTGFAYINLVLKSD